ncbi:MAG: hypothetical protein HY329_21275 [Chloroflexi bacterium]|nr:hypothetical protein [Chloroflexota bacterium]
MRPSAKLAVPLVVLVAITLTTLAFPRPLAGAGAPAPGDLLVSDEGPDCATGGPIWRLAGGAGAPSALLQGSPFVKPRGFTIDRQGQMIVADGQAGIIRSVPGGSATVVAGGLNRGRPFQPRDVLVDADGSYVAVDWPALPSDPNGTDPSKPAQVVRVSPSGSVTTIAAGAPLAKPHGIDRDAAGNYIVADHSGTLIRVTPQGQMSVVASGFLNPTDVRVEAVGTYIVTDLALVQGTLGAIYRVTSTGTVTTLARGGPGQVVQRPRGVVLDGLDLVVNDYGTQPGTGKVYRLDAATGQVKSVIKQGSPFCRPADILFWPTVFGVTPTPVPPAQPTTGYVPTVRNGVVDPTFGGTWRTGLQVFNLDKNRTTNVNVRFVRPDGSQAGAAPPVAIASGKSRTFFGDSIGAAEGFNGSAVITADSAVGVIVNQLAQDTGLSGSFNWIAATGTKVFAPIALRSAGGTSTSLHIQNAGTAATSSLEARFFALDQPAPTATVRLSSLAPGAAVELGQASLPDLPSGFQGSAVVESDQPLALVVNQSNGKSLLSSAGQVTGASTLYGPLVLNNNGGFSSSIQVQNAGSGSASVTVKVFDSATGALAGQQSRTLPPGAAANWPLGTLLGREDRFVGSAIVEAGAGSGIIGIVNQVNQDTNQASAYSLFASGAAAVVAPLVQTSNSGWNSGFQVQNVGTSEATVTMMVTDTAGNVIGSVPSPTRTIQPGKSETWFPITALGTRVVGSALATGSAGARLVGVVNQLNQESGAVDFFTTYEAISQ